MDREVQPLDEEGRYAPRTHSTAGESLDEPVQSQGRKLERQPAGTTRGRGALSLTRVGEGGRTVEVPDREAVDKQEDIALNNAGASHKRRTNTILTTGELNAPPRFFIT